MTDRIRKRLEYLKSGEYKSFRRQIEGRVELPAGSSNIEISRVLFNYMLANEGPVLYGDDRIGFNRTVINTPCAVIDGNVVEKEGVGNLTPDYEYVLGVGMDELACRIAEKLKCCQPEQRELYIAMQEGVAGALALADSYREYALKQGATQLYEALCQVPHKGAQSFHQACVFVKFIQHTLRCNRSIQITLGGFDKYMKPYFDGDISRGVSEDELFETLEDFFISLNIDSDIYYGFQQGDNGMSMVLGGRDVNGEDRYSRLSELCIEAARELCLIDPKINLRVDKSTPIERFEFATELTKKGLGFPQYCNDDVVIPALLKWGYAPRDAYDYTVAACWEFIASGNGYDVPNITVLSFPEAVNKAVKERLCSSHSFEEFLQGVRDCVSELSHNTARRMIAATPKILRASPYLSVFVSDCIERGLDVSQGGAVYNNYGAHGAGISSAADAIAAVKKAVFDEKICSAEELISAIDSNFEGCAELRNYLLSCPKMGNNDDSVDCYAELLMNTYSQVLGTYKNKFGGILRAGTGSAQKYYWAGTKLGATADGRYARASFASSFSPSLNAKISGPLSCIQSFAKHDLTDIMNGGPLTMEIHDNTFRNHDGVRKVAALVKAFVDLGGHQLQLNAVNRDRLLEAQKHPEEHKDLIVRVWGWSGYFCELDRVYQDHIIARTEFSV